MNHIALMICRKTGYSTNIMNIPIQFIFLTDS